MPDRADDLIRQLEMRPHPEGGHFREVYRSSRTVRPDDGRPPRLSLTTIYFLLRAGEHSALHRVQSDEVWHFYEGDPLELVWWDASSDAVTRAQLAEVDVSGTARPVATVPAGCWQAARSTGRYTLVGCTVGPGFDFADFTMIRDDAEATGELRRRHPELADYI